MKTSRVAIRKGPGGLQGPPGDDRYVERGLKPPGPRLLLDRAVNVGQPASPGPFTYRRNAPFGIEAMVATG